MTEKIKSVPFDGDIAKSVNVKLSLETVGDDGVSDELYQNLYSWLCNAFQQERNHWKKQLDSTFHELNRQHKESLSFQNSLQKLLDKFNQNPDPVIKNNLERPSSCLSQNDDEFVTVDIEEKAVTIESLLINLEAQIGKLISRQSNYPVKLTTGLQTQSKIGQIFPGSNATYVDKTGPITVTKQQQTYHANRSEEQRKQNEQISPKYIKTAQRPTPILREKRFIELPQPRDKNGLALPESTKLPKSTLDKSLNVTKQKAPGSIPKEDSQKIVWQQDKESIILESEQNSSSISKVPSHIVNHPAPEHNSKPSQDSTDVPLRVENNEVSDRRTTPVHKPKTALSLNDQHINSTSEIPADRETLASTNRQCSSHANLEDGNDIQSKISSALQPEKVPDKLSDQVNTVLSADNKGENIGEVTVTAIKDSQTNALPISQCHIWSSVPKQPSRQHAVVHPYLKKNSNKVHESFSVKKIYSFQQEERQQYEKAIQSRNKEIKFLKSDLEEALDQVENLQKVIQRLYLLNKHLKETPKSVKDNFVEDNDGESQKVKRSKAENSKKVLSSSLPSLKNLPMFQPMSASEMAVWKLKVKQKHLPSRKTDLAHCLRCQQLFRPAENNNVSCRYHRNGQECTEKYDSRGNLVRVLYKWSCCQREIDAPGCTHSQHI